MLRTQVLTPVLVAGFISGASALVVAQQQEVQQERVQRPGGAAADQPRAAAPVAPRPDPAAMQQILLDWETQSAKLRTLEVSIYRIDRIPNWGEEEHYVGSAAFQNPRLAFLDFRKVKMELQYDAKDKKKKVLVPVKKNGQVVSTPHETIVCTAADVWQYRYDVRRIVIFPLDKDMRRRALEEGPLPFLFNMKAAEAAQRYQMTLHGEDDKTYLVKVKPLLHADSQNFSTAWIYLNRQFLLPTRIVLVSPDRQRSQDYRLSNIRANKPVEARKFVGVTPAGWKVERNPANPAPAPVGDGGARRAPSANAAARPGDDGQAMPR